VLDPKSLPQPKTIPASESASFSRTDFLRIINESYQPLVIKGFASNWEIVQAAKSARSTKDLGQYLLQHLQSTALSLTRIPHDQQSRMFYQSDLQKMNFGIARLPSLDCFDRMLQAHSDADYAVQCVPIEQHFPTLLPGLRNSLVPPSTSPFIWLGNKVIVAPHFDEDDNLAVVVCGRRRFTLFPPQQTKNLYVGPLDVTPAGQPISLVNVLNPDLEVHPKYQEAHANALSVELEVGDAIYIPTPWWHHVQSLSDFNVLINYWWSETPKGCEPFPVLLHAIQSISHMSDDRKDAWQAIMQHYLFSQDESRSAHLPDGAKGVLNPLSQQQLVSFKAWLKQYL